MIGWTIGFTGLVLVDHLWKVCFFWNLVVLVVLKFEALVI